MAGIGRNDLSGQQNQDGGGGQCLAASTFIRFFASSFIIQAELELQFMNVSEWGKSEGGYKREYIFSTRNNERQKVQGVCVLAQNECKTI